MTGTGKGDYDYEMMGWLCWDGQYCADDSRDSCCSRVFRLRFSS